MFSLEGACHFRNHFCDEYMRFAGVYTYLFLKRVS